MNGYCHNYNRRYNMTMNNKIKSNHLLENTSLFGEFNKEVLLACQSINATSTVGLEVVKKEITKEEKMISACESSDYEWAIQLQKEGLDPCGDYQRGLGAESLFKVWWNFDSSSCDSYSSYNSIHAKFNPERLESMIKWLDTHNVGLGYFNKEAYNDTNRYNLNSKVDSGQTIATFRDCHKKGGESKKKARLWMVQEWLNLPTDIPKEHQRLVENYAAALSALFNYSKTWASDSDVEARVSSSEILDVLCEKAGLSEASIKTLEFALICFNESLGQERWRKVATNCLSAERKEFIGLSLSRVIAKDKWIESLDEFNATALAAVAIKEANPKLLSEVAKVSTKIDWSLNVLGVYIQKLAERALGDSKQPSVYEGRLHGQTIAALHFARLSFGYTEKNEYRERPDKRFYLALYSISDAVQAAIDHPLPEVFFYSSAAETMNTCKEYPQFALPNNHGRSLAHVWAFFAKNTDDIDRIRRVMGSPLSKVVCSPDNEGTYPIDLIDGKSLSGTSLKMLNDEIAKWEKKQLGKDLGRKTKQLAPKKMNRI